MADDSYATLQQPLWKPRPVEQTIAIYRDWAANYNADVTNAGYATPDRCAVALAEHLSFNARLLDFGCGTGLSGQAMTRAGFENIQGVEITPEMLDLAQATGVYKRLWLGEPGKLTNVAPGDFDAILAVGVISLGAAPPETLSLLLDHLSPGGLIVLSFNDPTLADGTYDALLRQEVAAGRAEVLSRSHGNHLPGKNMGSDVIVLKRL